MAIRLGETPVPIPNTMVKAQTADGTALETVWESRWPPDHKKFKDEFGETSEIFLPKGNGVCSEVSTDCHIGNYMKSLSIDTGKDEQQLIAANPISRAVLL